MGMSVEKLSYGEQFTSIYGLEDPDLQYPFFDHHGAVLNSRGFPGSISFNNCTIANNLVYIPYVRPNLNSKSTVKEPLSSFYDKTNDQINTKICASSTKTLRFFTDYLSSFHEQPSHEISQVEKYSPIFIQNNEGPMIFINNNFLNNTGIFGGAISIDTPNFQSEVKLSIQQQDPAIVLEGNTFLNNQAYLSGNAVYVRNTRNRTAETEENEVCGGSF